MTGDMQIISSAVQLMMEVRHKRGIGKPKVQSRKRARIKFEIGSRMLTPLPLLLLLLLLESIQARRNRVSLIRAEVVRILNRRMAGRGLVSGGRVLRSAYCTHGDGYGGHGRDIFLRFEEHLQLQVFRRRRSSFPGCHC